MEYTLYINYASRDEIWSIIPFLSYSEAEMLIRKRDQQGMLTWESLLDFEKEIEEALSMKFEKGWICQKEKSWNIVKSFEYYKEKGLISFDQPTGNQNLPLAALKCLLSHHENKLVPLMQEYWYDITDSPLHLLWNTDLDTLLQQCKDQLHDCVMEKYNEENGLTMKMTTDIVYRCLLDIKSFLWIVMRKMFEHGGMSYSEAVEDIFQERTLLVGYGLMHGTHSAECLQKMCMQARSKVLHDRKLITSETQTAKVICSSFSTQTEVELHNSDTSVQSMATISTQEIQCVEENSTQTMMDQGEGFASISKHYTTPVHQDFKAICNTIDRVAPGMIYNSSLSFQAARQPNHGEVCKKRKRRGKSRKQVVSRTKENTWSTAELSPLVESSVNMDYFPSTKGSTENQQKDVMEYYAHSLVQDPNATETESGFVTIQDSPRSSLQTESLFDQSCFGESSGSVIGDSPRDNVWCNEANTASVKLNLNSNNGNAYTDVTSQLLSQV